ncbi:hypothetical protein IQ260_23155 [Leptolyngbya cf. ectocarpi LEGE 11479]|uniref:Uncharacterized protein n=1 Tax=Leptolyngbya cf. ectocarpi LEGE 11479 TaxID=1828722 RepID=A0A929FCG1_LEPEC|nr:hypothetical protein [Leptolyngbya ectocarpi]MBE9069548.1 hypothetical protein [Leptolyngbya cf. ectocarpi LEGE 11479]
MDESSQVLFLRDGRMDTSLLRLIWSVVEETPAAHLRRKGERDRMRLLLKKIDSRVILSPQERSQVQQYLMERSALIQEICLEQAM